MEPGFRRSRATQAIDGLTKRPLSQQPATPAAEQPSEPSKKKKHPQVKTGLMLLGGVLAGATIFAYQPIAELLICVFGVIAVIRRVSSQTVFILALIALAVVPVAEITGRLDVGLAFSSYAFLLLGFATICLGREISRGTVKRSVMDHK